MTAIANPIARGTVRAVSRTSPLGTSALSTPANAKIRNSEARATSPTGGTTSIARLLALTKNAPPMATRSSGSSLATVAIEFRRTLNVTPRKLMNDQKAYAATNTTADAARPASAGTSCPTLAANTVETAAVANVPSMNSRTPEIKPKYGPNAVPT